MKRRLVWAGLSGAAVAAAAVSVMVLTSTVRVSKLTPGHLAFAATEAGFVPIEAKVEMPKPIRSRFPVPTIDYHAEHLRELRERFQLEKVVGNAWDEWSAQLMLKAWVHEQITDGVPKVHAENAIAILEQAAEGEAFYCTHFAITYEESAQALGWQARRIGVDRQHGRDGMESEHHGVAEIWSNQFAKWMVVDPQSNLHFERDGVPLSAWEIRAEWLKDKGAAVRHVVGAPLESRHENPAIIWWDRAEDETSLYFWLYITIPGSPMEQIFPQDANNYDQVWYQNDTAQGGQIHPGYRKNRFLVTQDFRDGYWTVGIVEPIVESSNTGTVELRLDSYCPNLLRYEALVDDGKDWKSVKTATVSWRLKDGSNSLRLRTVSDGDVVGPETRLLLWLTTPASHTD